MGIFASLIVGAIAGWLAGKIMKGGGYGLIGNIVIGIIGAVVGGFVFDLLDISTGGILGTIVMATLGAVILIYAVRLIKKA